MDPRYDTIPSRSHFRRRALRRLAPAAAVPLVLLALAAAFAASGGDDGSDSTSVSLRATGPVTIGNSQAGKAIFTATNMRPGQSKSGTVTITNNGGSASYVLSQFGATTTPGKNGGDIRPQLTLKVEDITSGTPVVVYSSAFASMPDRPLGTFGDGEARTYRFTATFNSLGTPTSNTTGDNLYQGSSASVGFTWTATAPDTTPPPTTDSGTGGSVSVTEQPQTESTPSITPSGGGGGGLPILGLGGASTQKTPDYVTFFATCNQACTLTIGGTVNVPGGAKIYRLSKVSKQLRAGVKTKVTVKFATKVRKAIRKAVRRRKTVTVALSLGTKNAAGASSTSTRRIRIKK